MITSVQDVKDRYEGDLNTRYTDTYIQTKIEDAEALIEQDYPSVAGRLASGALLDQNYKRIVAFAVLRVLRNPEGYVIEGEANVNVTRNKNVASGELAFTDAEVYTLAGVKPTASDRVPSSVGVSLDSGWA